MGKALAQKNLTVKAQVEQTEDMAAMREVTCPHSPTAYLMGKLMGWQVSLAAEKLDIAVTSTYLDAKTCKVFLRKLSKPYLIYLIFL